jgi:hypothetical protein
MKIRTLYFSQFNFAFPTYVVDRMTVENIYVHFDVETPRFQSNSKNARGGEGSYITLQLAFEKKNDWIAATNDFQVKRIEIDPEKAIEHFGSSVT